MNSITFGLGGILIVEGIHQKKKRFRDSFFANQSPVIAIVMPVAIMPLVAVVMVIFLEEAPAAESSQYQNEQPTA